MEYSVSSLGKGEIVYTVTDSQLSIHKLKGDQRTDIPLSEVRKARILSMQGIYYTYLWSPQGKIRILSRSIRGPGRYEDRPTEYKLFVQELHEQLAKANRNIVYAAGSTAIFIMGWVLVVLGLSGLVLRWGFGLRGTLPIALSAGLGLPLVLLGRVKTYSPEALPAKYLP